MLFGALCIKETTSQEQFEHVKQFIHFTYNNEMIEDKSNPAYDRTLKFRPIIDYFNIISTTTLLARDLCIDGKNLCY